ncbi:hypothetical protein SLEP1_g16890 [Rubroshorea leprosula]|uniref:Acyltransferase C-terminal domain-containing protein n=1 Tax=Rubroshorea leprosula TaxID=152421 RepID=A0AAV5J3Z7_9ROSI|nr:hypothetical protein SLEP1_g16890 [Rubroshorea leprosula]
MITYPNVTNLPNSSFRSNCLNHALAQFNVLYVSIAYKHKCLFFLYTVFGVDLSEVHIHVRHIPIKEIPTSEDENTSLLIYAFKLKKKLPSDFKLQDHIPKQELKESFIL